MVLFCIVVVVCYFKCMCVRDRETVIYYLFIEGIYPRQPHRVTSGLFTSSNLLTQVEYNTKHAYYISVNYINIIPKLFPSVLLL